MGELEGQGVPQNVCEKHKRRVQHVRREISIVFAADVTRIQAYT